MKVSRDFLLEEAESTGFRPEILEQVLYLVNLLNRFNSHRFLEAMIGAQGWMALD